MSPLPARRFYMMRHGESLANVAGTLAGSIDSPLSPTGQAQARDARRIVETLPVPPVLIVHSALSRARDTARIVNESLCLPMREDADLGEINGGDLEGQSFDIFRDHVRQRKDPPGGERLDDFTARAVRAIARALSILPPDDPSPILIVAHGGIFRAFGELYGVSIRGVENCHLIDCIPDPEQGGFPWLLREYELTDQGARHKDTTLQIAPLVSTTISVAASSSGSKG